LNIYIGELCSYGIFKQYYALNLLCLLKKEVN